jgi:hypothetical protein
MEQQWLFKGGGGGGDNSGIKIGKTLKTKWMSLQ